MKLYRHRLSCYVILLILVTCHLTLLLYSAVDFSIKDYFAASLLSRKLRYQREMILSLDTFNITDDSSRKSQSRHGIVKSREDLERARSTPVGYNHVEGQIDNNVTQTSKLTDQRFDSNKEYEKVREGNIKEPPSTARYSFNCSNVEQIKIKYKIGHGVTKQVYLGTIRDKHVAVKMVTRNVLDVTSCVKAKKNNEIRSNRSSLNKDDCYTFPNMKLMKEILIMEQIQHQNLVRMLGYCVRSVQTESTSLQDHGVIAVYEYASRFYVNSLSSWSLRDRLRAAVEMADLLQYLEFSPLGSLRIADLKEDHFLLKDGHIKMTDLDDVTSLEPRCIVPVIISNNKSNYGSHTLLLKSDQLLNSGSSFVTEDRHLCHYGIRCQGGICPGYNAKFNLDNMNRIIFKKLLSLEGNLDMDTEVISGLISIQHSLDRLRISAADLEGRLQKLLTLSALSV